MRTQLLAAIGLVVVGTITLGAGSAQDMKSLKGVIRIDGSSTMYPITEAVAEEFSKVAPKINVTVGISGTGGGFKRFTAGETDISDASRPIKAAEAAMAATNKIGFIEVPIAFDALTFVVHPKNDWVKSLSVAQIKKIYSANSPAKTWKDVDPSWPDRVIKVFSPGTDSGTFDYFKEVAVGKDGKVRSDMSVSEDDNALVTGVAGDVDAIGYFGLAYFVENADKISAVAIDTGKGIVAPSADTVNNGTYVPFSRPLFLYVSAKSAGRPEVQAFVEYYLENGPELAKEVGYVALPSGVAGAAAANWKARKLGSPYVVDGKDVAANFTESYK